MLNTQKHTYTYSSLTGYEPRLALTNPLQVILEHLNTLLSRVNLSMPFQNRLQYNRQWDIVIPATICALLGLIGQINLLIRITMFWNFPNRNFNTFIAQFTFTSHNENWEALFIDIHIDRERSNRANPTPGRSPMSDTLQYVRNWRSHPSAPQEPHEETLDKEYNTAEEIDPAISRNLADIGVPIPGPPNYRTSEIFHHEQNEWVPPSPRTIARARLPQT